MVVFVVVKLSCGLLMGCCGGVCMLSLCWRLLCIVLCRCFILMWMGCCVGMIMRLIFRGVMWLCGILVIMLMCKVF